MGEGEEEEREEGEEGEEGSVCLEATGPHTNTERRWFARVANGTLVLTLERAGTLDQDQKVGTMKETLHSLNLPHA